MKTLKFFSAIAMMALVATTVACKDTAKKSGNDDNESEKDELINEDLEANTEDEATDIENLADMLVPGQEATLPTQDGNTITAEVKESPTGLIYAIFDKGDNTNIEHDTQATVRYRGMHADGSIFDEGEAAFAPSMVIPGFGEGLMMLGKGGKAFLGIPGNLGYGEAGVPQAGIEPNETLYFLVEIVDIAQ